MSGSSYPDKARVCDGWKRRPKNWNYVVDYNPHWHDQYIPRETQINLRSSYKLKGSQKDEPTK